MQNTLENKFSKPIDKKVEQYHHFIKKITKPMRGFKAFHSAQATLAGIELHHMLRKNRQQLSIICTLNSSCSP